MKYHIAICDDEQNQIEYLSGLVRNWAEGNGIMVNIHPFSSAEEFLFKFLSVKQSGRRAGHIFSQKMGAVMGSA